MLGTYLQGEIGNSWGGSNVLAFPDFETIVPVIPETTRPEQRRHYRTIWISDIHLGTRGCNADLLIDFLDHTDSETLYLVGDIIDGWRLKKRFYWPVRTMTSSGGCSNAPGAVRGSSISPAIMTRCSASSPG